MTQTGQRGITAIVFVLAVCGGMSTGARSQRGPAQATTDQPDVVRLLLRTPLSLPGIEMLTVTDGPRDLVVSLAGPPVLDYFGMTPIAPPTANLQVWVLKKDGTAVPHREGFANGAGRSSDNRWFRSVGLRFDRVPADTLAGVVIGVDGALTARSIPPP